MNAASHDSAVATLLACYRNARSGRGGVATITGPLSCGKSEVLEDLSVAIHADGGQVLRATGSATEQHLMGGIVDQLLRSSPDVDLDPVGLIGAEGLCGEQSWQFGSGLPPRAARMAHQLSSQLLEIGGGTASVVLVDDVHFVDLASQHVLAALARRMRTLPLLLILAGRNLAESGIPVLANQISSMPVTAVILEPLTASDIGRMVQRLGPAVAESVATWHELTGGSPTLVKALVEDWQASVAAAGAGDSGAVVAGATFGQAVLAGLQGWGHDLLAVARVSAVTVNALAPEAIADIVGQSPDQVRKLLGVLDNAGLLAQGRMRHAAVADAVAATISAAEQTALHDRIARVLFDRGVDAIDIARHVLAGSGVDEEWALSVLISAGRRALGMDDIAFAERCAEAVSRTSSARSVAGLVLRMNTSWRVGPAHAGTRIAQLVDAMAAGELTDDEVIQLCRLCLWAGDDDNAAAAQDLLVTREKLTDPRLSIQLASARRWYAGLEPLGIPDEWLQPGSTAVAPWMSSALAISRDGFAADADSAEALVQSCVLSVESYELINRALTILTVADRLDVAARWAGEFLEQAKRGGSRAWEAMMRSHLAAIALQRGRLIDAADAAQRGMETISLDNWGRLVGHPLATLLIANSRLGRQDSSESWLRRVTPDAFDGWHGLGLVRARGVHHLSAERRLAAMADFQRCQTMLAGRDLALEQIVPWRLDLAEVNISLGRNAVAEELVRTYAEKVRPKDARTRGRARVLLARCRPLLERRGLLEKAVGELEQSLDHYGLAECLKELAEVYQALSELDRARAAIRRAGQERKACQLIETARPMVGDRSAGSASAGSASAGGASVGAAGEAFGGTADSGASGGVAGAGTGVATLAAGDHARVAAAGDGSVPGPASADGIGGSAVAARGASANSGVAGLSEAQRRVAELAALGHTNQEISRKLFITVSTVEQHLTRVFRKLGVDGRDQLWSLLHTDPAETTALSA